MIYSIRNRITNLLAKLAQSPKYEPGITPKFPIEFYLQEGIDVINRRSMSTNTKQLLVKCLVDAGLSTSSDDYEALCAELFDDTDVVSITADYDQGDNRIYINQPIDDLRQYLTVYATYANGEQHEVSDYILIGTIVPGDVPITVEYAGKTDSFIAEITVELVSWAEGTPEQIAMLLESAHSGKIDLQTDAGWAVGDTRTVHIDAFTGGGNKSHSAQDVEIVITSFADYNNCGCVMQFDFKNCLVSTQRIYASNTNTGGYGSSEMKSTTIPALISALPEWLRNRLVEFDVLASLADSYDNTSVQTVIGNKLALRAVEEITGVSPYNNSAYEGTLTDYYSTPENRIKKRGTSNSDYSTRSAYPSSMFIIGTGGSATSTNANTETGFAPFGCL